MKKLYFVLVTLFLVNGAIVNSFSQKVSLNITFTAIDNNSYIQLDSIKVMNRTQGDSFMLYWPDTTLAYVITPGDLMLYIGYAMDYPVGVQSISDRERQFQLFQIFPNPVRDQAVISIYVPAKGAVDITIADVRGRIAVKFNRNLDEGTHFFRFDPGDERIYFLTARWYGITQSIKIINDEPIKGKTCRLEYTGMDKRNPSLKQSQLKAGLVSQESGILDPPYPYSHLVYTFQFATNTPCPGTPTVDYEGQVYNTIQIFSQCWLKENLNVGTMIYGSMDQTDNGIKEKYCYNNEPDSCTKFGGLYLWDEMMQYTTLEGVRGICPTGWHLPTDEEWKVLEGAVDSQYGIGETIWDYKEYRGYDAGANLKITSGWYANGNGADLFGFSGQPGGWRYTEGDFDYIGYFGGWWTSTKKVDLFAWRRYLQYDYPEVHRTNDYKQHGFSVRCLRNY